MTDGRPVVALVDDLMDRSRLSGAIAELGFARDVAGCVGARTVIVDIARHGDTIAELRRVAPDARIICYGPHVDVDGTDRARAAGADIVVPRSRFFRDPGAAITSIS